MTQASKQQGVALCALILGLCASPVHAQSHWQDADLTALTGAPNAAGTPLAMVFDPAWQTMRTHYISADRHIHELFLSGNRWQDADLTVLSRGVSAFGTTIATLFDPIWNAPRTHYIGVDRHVHELFLNGTHWQDADLTSLTGGANALGTGIAMTYDPVWKISRTHYVGADQHVHELYLSGTHWAHADLTAIAGGPATLPGSIAMTFDAAWKTPRTHYMAADQHVHELYLSGTTWQDADLTKLAGGPNAQSGAIAMMFDSTWNTSRTHYVAADQHVHEFYFFGNSWHDADMTKLTGGPDPYWSGIAMSFDPTINAGRTHYVAAARHVNEFFLSGSTWANADLTMLGKGAVAAYGTSIAMAFDRLWKGMRTHYVAANQHVHELFLVPDAGAGVIPIPAWAQQAIDAKAAQAGLGQPISAMQSIDAFTYMEQFQNGDVYWSLPTGAHEVHGEIKHKYDFWGDATGFLGLPFTDETGAPDGFGRFNHFEHGSIYWTDHTGPMTVSGPIRDKWASLGWEHSFLGYPVTDQVRWRTENPATDQFIAWNLFENGAIVTTKNITDVAGAAHITPDQLQYLVHRAVDKAVHQMPDNIGLYPDIQITGVSNWEGDFMASKGRAIGFKLHGFHDNGILGDAEFHFWFALRFSLSTDPTSLTDPWYRSLHAELIPGSVGIDVDGISGWFASPDDYKQKIEAAFQNYADIAPFPVTTKEFAPQDPVRLVIIDAIATAAGGIDFLITPEPPFAGTTGSFVPLIQQKIDNFIQDF